MDQELKDEYYQDIKYLLMIEYDLDDDDMDDDSAEDSVNAEARKIFEEKYGEEY